MLTPAECCDQCKKKLNCKRWSLFRNICWLKNTGRGRKTKAPVVSGVVCSALSHGLNSSSQSPGVANSVVNSVPVSLLSEEQPADYFHNKVECRDVFESPRFVRTFQSQVDQDMEVFYRYFAHLGPSFKGFYVDAAAADPIRLSNSYFFDICLGWSGICIEGLPARAKMLREQRTCTVVESLITNADGDDVYFQVPEMFGGETLSNKIVGGGSEHVQKFTGLTLATILARHNVTKINYFSLDIEGFELPAIESIDWGKVDVDVLTVEINNKFVKPALLKKGFVFQRGLGWEALDELYTGSSYSLDLNFDTSRPGHGNDTAMPHFNYSTPISRSVLQPFVPEEYKETLRSFTAAIPVAKQVTE